MIILYIVLAVIAVLAIFLWVTYNALVKLRVRVEEAWSDITVQLKRRADLIPNLIETVKGYAAHEKTVLNELTEARASMMQASDSNPKEAAKAENQFEGALKSLFAVAENYPDLKANENYLQLQNELVDTEDKIQASRRFYNGGVRDLNTKIQQFPSNIIASMFSFKNKEFFEVDNQEAIAEPVPVKF